MTEESKFYLKDTDVPKQWYNLSSDLKEPMSPPLHPGTKEPIGPDDLAPLFPMELIMQEVSQDRYIDIPKPVLNALYEMEKHSTCQSKSFRKSFRYTSKNLL